MCWTCGVLTWWGHTQGPHGGPYGGDHEVTDRTVSRLEGPCGQGGHCLSTPEAKPSPGNTQWPRLTAHFLPHRGVLMGHLQGG